MRIAVMQPYFFPYIGYFQLIKSADIFILYDDVTFIKKGWIHRNKLCFNNTECWFTIPVKDASQYREIKDTKVCDAEIAKWERKFFASIACFYGKQRHVSEGRSLVEQALSLPYDSIAELAENSLRLCCRYLGITTPIMRSSQLDVPATLSREKRLIEICRRYHADRYINASGGQELYSQNMFSPYNIQLEFIHPLLKPYRVRGRNFMPGLSVLDAIMCCGSAFVAESLLGGYAIVEAV